DGRCGGPSRLLSRGYGAIRRPAEPEDASQDVSMACFLQAFQAFDRRAFRRRSPTRTLTRADQTVADDYRTTEVGERYAQALFDLADETGALEAVRADLKSLRAAWNDSADLRRLATSPVMASDDQRKGLVAIADAAKFNGVTRNFLGLLGQNGRARDLPGVIAGFEKLYAKKMGVVAAEVVSAQPLSAAQRKTV